MIRGFASSSAIGGKGADMQSTALESICHQLVFSAELALVARLQALCAARIRHRPSAVDANMESCLNSCQCCPVDAPMSTSDRPLKVGIQTGVLHEEPCPAATTAAAHAASE